MSHYLRSVFQHSSIGWRQSHHQKIVFHLQNCSNFWELKQVHAQLIRTQLIDDVHLSSRVIAFLATSCANSTSLNYCHRVFLKISHPNIFIWNSMIRNYVHNDLPVQALQLYKQMIRRGFSSDGHTYPIIIRACTSLRAVITGETIHGLVLKHGLERDMYVVSGFTSFYASCELIATARELFDHMPEKDVVAWTSIISGYAQSDHSEEAFTLFEAMKEEGVEPNNATFICLANACGQLKNLDKAQWLHSYISKKEMDIDLMVGNSLISMYAKCGSTSMSIEVFDKMQVKNVISWNALIGGLVKNRQYSEALRFFKEMKRSGLKPNKITFASILSVCAQLKDLQQGKDLYALIDEHHPILLSDTCIQNALVNMYASSGDLPSALHVFNGMLEPDVISWTALVSGYLQANLFSEALILFRKMWLSHVRPNEVTLVCLLSACAQLGALNQGRQIHSYIEVNIGIGKDLHPGNALVDMYAKCGCVETALLVFEAMDSKDVYSWNTMIGAMAAHGRGREAIDLFDFMQKTDDVKPDNVTFIAVLCGCAHSGMVKEAYYYFNLMSSLYKIVPELKHYGCIVDALTRAGKLDDAYEFIMRMPVQPSHVIWGSLLAACRTHQRIKLAEKALEQIKRLAPNDEGAYLVMSNVYAEERRWDDVSKVRRSMNGMGIRKSPGCSSVSY